MPYSSNEELPDSVRGALPSAAQSRFRSVVNDALRRGLSESKAFASAWSVVRNGWKPAGEGEKWVRKERSVAKTFDEVYAGVLEKGFDPQQPRDERGRWSPSGGGGSGGGPADAKDVKQVVRALPLDSARATATTTPGVFEFEAIPRSGQDSFDLSDEIHIGLVRAGFDVKVQSVRTSSNGGLRMRAAVTVPDTQKSEDWDVSAEILKVDDEQRLAWGWASVATIKAIDHVDTQNDIIEPEELVKAATEFMENTRTAKAMHDGDAIGAIIHSLPLTKEIAKSLGLDTDREGWIIGMKVYSDEVWKRVKAGELKAFSIAGRAERVGLDDAA